MSRYFTVSNLMFYYKGQYQIYFSQFQFSCLNLKCVSLACYFLVQQIKNTLISFTKVYFSHNHLLYIVNSFASLEFEEQNHSEPQLGITGSQSLYIQNKHWTGIPDVTRVSGAVFKC